MRLFVVSKVVSVCVLASRLVEPITCRALIMISGEDR